MSGNSDQSGGAAPPQNLNQQQAPLQEERGQPHGPPPPGFHAGPPPYGYQQDGFPTQQQPGVVGQDVFSWLMGFIPWGFGPNLQQSWRGNHPNQQRENGWWSQLWGPVGQDFSVDNSQFTINDFKHQRSYTVRGNRNAGYPPHTCSPEGHWDYWQAPPNPQTVPTGDSGRPQMDQDAPHGHDANSQPIRGRMVYNFGHGNTAVIDNGVYEYENGVLVSGPDPAERRPSAAPTQSNL